jgi:hypothetical protein
MLLYPEPDIGRSIPVQPTTDLAAHGFKALRNDGSHNVPQREGSVVVVNPISKKEGRVVQEHLQPPPKPLFSSTQPPQRTRIQILIQRPSLPLLITSSPRRNRRPRRTPRQRHPLNRNPLPRTRRPLHISNLMLLQIHLRTVNTLHRPQRVPPKPLAAIAAATSRSPSTVIHGAVVVFESPRESCVASRTAIPRSQSDEFAEDGEFHFQLDAVDDAFEGLLEDVAVLVFDDKESNIHHHNKNINAKQLPHNPRSAPLPHHRINRRRTRRRTDNIQSLPDVQAGEDEFLQRETGHLDFLDVLVRVCEGCLLRGVVGAEEHDDGRDVEDERVDYYHVLDACEDFLVRLAEHYV